MPSKLQAICPLDGRYQRNTGDLAKKLGREALSSIDAEDWEAASAISEHASSIALSRNRIQVEARYVEHLAKAGLTKWSEEDLAKLSSFNNVGEEEAQRLSDIEFRGVPGINNGMKTEHDLKAIEYHMRDVLGKQGVSLENLVMIHIGLTSEDADNISVNSMLSGCQSVLLKKLGDVYDTGQVPPEFARGIAELSKLELTAKLGGAMGNRSAHRFAFPDVDWESFAKKFVESFDLEYYPLTTQVEPSDTVSELFQSLIGINERLLLSENAVQGSYVNDLLGISTALAEEFCRKQPISRRQRDLSGSTIRRNYGTAFAFTIAAAEYGLKSRAKDTISTGTEISDLAFKGTNAILPALDELLGRMVNMADEYKSAVMMGKTHGQPAIPTTLGKEIAVFAYRVYHQRQKLDAVLKRKDALNSFRTLKRINVALVDFAQDVWQYISDEYILQKAKEGEVGSSTMAQKINPIKFENGEGNLLIANTLLDYFAKRFAGGLFTKALAENMGMPLGYSIAAYNSLLDGMGRIRGNPDGMRAEVENGWSTLSEAIQTELRRVGVGDAYEVMKDLTRGKDISSADIKSFVGSLKIDEAAKQKMLGLTPSSYIGDAVGMTEKAVHQIRAYLQKPLDKQA